VDLKPVDWSKVECCFVYCYLREKDQTPYYVGIAKRRDRITAHHTVHIPPNRAYIRCMRSGLTHKEAQAWEQFYIAHYGRKDTGTGILRNQTDGGETGGLGRVWTEEMRKRHSEALTGRTLSEECRAKLSATKTGQAMTPARRKALKPYWDEVARPQAEKMGVDVEAYCALPTELKKKVVDRFKYGGFKPEDLMKDLDGENRYERAGLRQKLGAAEKYGIDPDFYLTLNDKQRLKIAGRYSEGMRGERLTQHLDLNMRTARSLERYECTLEQWNSLTTNQKAKVKHRWKKGLRGADLFYQLPDS